ncbi:tRNA (adenine(58)-N(1))-methyltransferase catalytic subunit TRMT61A [Hypsibius exemplaris]|uniref:tRNA (adenine(58)-N(1))-methyltransferase catalytic subunit TRMT61A n=1 Tax=Hypsibius exemplaris TaxID=2072580 RepID=A0A9X6NDB8_HYPEX|nr:tRNA (adenine(58)-N(1))-methyltransferase catalytic subunit TRMT61A [Hypsibius exemplaris]
MSFLTSSNHPTVAEGDTVMIYIDYSTILAAQIDLSAKQSVIHTKKGPVSLKNLIGHRYGTKLTCKSGYVQILQPTPELWTKTLPFRTQILYLPDISMIVMHLDLKPGSLVGESGTGSGSLSHAIARTVAPSGHLYTFDYHDVRVQQARKEVVQHGLEDIITVQLADVYENGYGTLENHLDAVMLDLPMPWLAIPHAKKALKKGGSRVGSFSPCIEQVQRTCEELKKHGFSDLVTLECLMRPLEVKVMNMNSWQPPEVRAAGVDGDRRPKTPFSQISFSTAIIPKEVPGHSGFLTFASLF